MAFCPRSPAEATPLHTHPAPAPPQTPEHLRPDLPPRRSASLVQQPSPSVGVGAGIARAQPLSGGSEGAGQPYHGANLCQYATERISASSWYTFMSHVYVCGPLCERGLVVAPDLPYTTVGFVGKMYERSKLEWRSDDNQTRRVGESMRALSFAYIRQRVLVV